MIRPDPLSPLLAVYLAVKSFACCHTRNLVGDQWLALVLAGSFGVVLCAVAFSVLSSLDKLGRVKGCVPAGVGGVEAAHSRAGCRQGPSARTADNVLPRLSCQL